MENNRDSECKSFLVSFNLAHFIRMVQLFSLPHETAKNIVAVLTKEGNRCFAQSKGSCTIQCNQHFNAKNATCTKLGQVLLYCMTMQGNDVLLHKRGICLYNHPFFFACSVCFFVTKIKDTNLVHMICTNYGGLNKKKTTYLSHMV